MGLDQYAIAVRRISDTKRNEINNNHPDLTNDCNYLFLTKNELDDSRYTDLMPFLTQVRASHQITDIEQMKKDFGVPADAQCVGRAFTGTRLIDHYYDADYKNNHKEYKVDIDVLALEDKYTKVITEDMWICLRRTIGQWRKDYDFDDAMQEAYGYCVENCGYALCNGDMIDLMKDDLKDDPSNYDAVFYHIWF